MKKLLFVSLFLFYLGSSLSNAAVIDFNDLYTGSGSSLGEIPTDYQGFKWSPSYWQYDYDGWMYNQFGVYTGFSLAETATLWHRLAVTISAPTTSDSFDFAYADFAGRWGPQTFSVEGYRYLGPSQYELVYSDTVSSGMELTRLHFNWEDVYQLKIYSLDSPTLYSDLGEWIGGGHHYLIDNLSVHSETVPLPSSVMLLGMGLISLVGFRNKFKKA